MEKILCAADPFLNHDGAMEKVGQLRRPMKEICL